MTRRTDTGRFSNRGRIATLTFVIMGLLTFLFPIIKFNPPAHGQEYWSVLDVALQLQSQLRGETPFAVLLSVPFGSVYLVLLVALGAVVLTPLRKVLLWVGLAGLFLLFPFRGMFGGIMLAALFDSEQRGGDLRTLWVILGIMMLAVTFVAWTDRTA